MDQHNDKFPLISPFISGISLTAGGHGKQRAQQLCRCQPKAGLGQTALQKESGADFPHPGLGCFLVTRPSQKSDWGPMIQDWPCKNCRLPWNKWASRVKAGKYELSLYNSSNYSHIKLPSTGNLSQHSLGDSKELLHVSL